MTKISMCSSPTKNFDVLSQKFRCAPRIFGLLNFTLPSRSRRTSSSLAIIGLQNFKREECLHLYGFGVCSQPYKFLANKWLAKFEWVHACENSGVLSSQFSALQVFEQHATSSSSESSLVSGIDVTVTSLNFANTV